MLSLPIQDPHEHGNSDIIKYILEHGRCRKKMVIKHGKDYYGQVGSLSAKAKAYS